MRIIADVYWESDRHQIIQGDALSVLRGMEEGSVSVCVTSPPYNTGVKYHSYHDQLSGGTYAHSMMLILHQLDRVVAEGGGSIFWIVGEGRLTEQWVTQRPVYEAGDHLHVQNHIIWVKSIALDGVGAHGHYRPINSARFLPDCWEHVFHLTRAGDVQLNRKAIGVPYEDPSNARRWTAGADGLRCRGNVWFVPYQTRHTVQDHPCPFPERLVEMCLRLHGLDQIETVIDPFCGSGTVSAVAASLGLRSVGIEIDEMYCEQSKLRLQATSSEPRNDP